MKKKLYEEILQDIREFSGISRDCAEMLIKKYSNILANTIHSILSIYTINQIKRSGYKSTKKQLALWKRWTTSKQNGEPPGIIVRLSGLSQPPSVIARSIIEYYYKNINRNATNVKIYECLKNTTLINNQDLAYEIYLSVLYDDRDGPISQAFAETIGYEYEKKLENCLIEQGIAFITEDSLRKKGYDKTPDIKLEIPIAIDGFVINWIESKARFADSSIHKDYCKRQFLSYWNRYGPGLVIYWFDFVDDIIQPNEKRFIVMNDFPKNITYMDPEILE